MMSLRTLLCMGILSFISHIFFAQTEFSDCTGAISLCNETLYLEELADFGRINELNAQLSCLQKDNNEDHSVWLSLRFKAEDVFQFSIDPIVYSDDIDFYLFEGQGDLCEALQELRCMSSGHNLGNMPHHNEKCVGMTGLIAASNDHSESKGCEFLDDNWLAAINVLPERNYFLCINNNTSTNGFELNISTNHGVEFDHGLLESTALFGMNGRKARLDLPHRLWSSARRVFVRSMADTSLILWNSFYPHKETPVFDQREESSQYQVVVETWGGCNLEKEVALVLLSNGDFDKYGVYFGDLSPNPTSNFVSLPVHSDQNLTMQCQILSMDGKQMYAEEYQINGTKTLTFAASAYPDGVYTLVLSHEDTRKAFTFTKL